MNQCVRRYVIVVFVLWAQHFYAQTTWTGNISSNWNLSTNWTNGLPGPFNEPTIPITPAGGVFPVITVFTYFNFNVQNFGTINIDGAGGVTLFGTLINHSGGTLILGNVATNFMVETMGTFENHGMVISNGSFNNSGAFVNAMNGQFGNNFIFSHADGSFLNQGQFNNFGQFFSEAQFQNMGIYDNFDLFNNNNQAVNMGVLTSHVGATLRNDLGFQNHPTGVLDIDGIFLNNHIFLNTGQVVASSNSSITNSYLLRNASVGNWNSQGTFNNVLCAIYENKGGHTNSGLMENEGVIYADQPILPQTPVNQGGGVVITPTNSGTLCHDTVVSLPLSSPAIITGLDLANDQFNFCSNWTILVNGQSFLSYSGCASLGQHSVTVSFTDPFGRTSICPATVTVVDDLAPSILCQPTLTVPASVGQCLASPTLAAPIVLMENCSVASITNNSPGVFQIGPTVVTWTVTDQHGNAATCQQTVVVQDLQPPSISCPNDKTFIATVGICGISSLVPEFSGDTAMAFDNCGAATVSNNAGAIFPVGSNAVTWTAKDAYGNANACQQTVTVLDNQPPVISSCPPDLTVEAQLAGCQAVVTWSPAVASDNCGAMSQIFSLPSGSVFDAGSTLVGVIVEDASGNSATCQFTVTVQDIQPPVWNNCPTNSTIVLLDCGDMAVGNWTIPTALDPCLDLVTSNYQPGVVLPIGVNAVVYTATDLIGNSSNCVFEITVEAQMAMNCPPDIVVNVEPGVSSSPVNWNTPVGVTNCGFCANDSINGFLFLGEKAGHRYYVYLGGQVSWQEAKTITEQHGGYLAAISSIDENELLRKELPDFFNGSWIGLNDEASEGQFSWVNGESTNFSNWANGGNSPQNDLFDFVVLQKDGFWVDESVNGSHTFLMELPCYSIDISSNDPVSLNSMVFSLGSTSVSYEYTDNCGNNCSCDFQVEIVQNQPVVPCIAKGNSAFGWIERVQTEGFSNSSGDDGGRGDFTSSLFQLPNPGCILKLTPGGPAVGKYIYWRIWADLNMDGDFFDDGEILGTLEGVGEQDFCYNVIANLPTGPVGFRIAMSRWDFVSACGDFGAGETEDYLVSFVDSSLFNPSVCDWSFDFFDGAKEDLKIKLDWLGMGNCDVLEFQVERSADGQFFENHGSVTPPTTGQTTSLYSYEDLTPFYGKNYYRIRAMLEDSTTVVSGIFEVDFDLDINSIFVYPNPATTNLILHVYPFSGLPAKIFIADAKGQIVYQKLYDILDNEAINFDVTGFAPGFYTIYLKAGVKREQVRRFTITQH